MRAVILFALTLAGCGGASCPSGETRANAGDCVPTCLIDGSGGTPQYDRDGVFTGCAPAMCSALGETCAATSDCCALPDTFALIQESYHGACVNAVCCKVMVAEGTDSDGKPFKTTCTTCGAATSCTYSP